MNNEAYNIGLKIDMDNEAILVTAVGSLPIRITKQFVSGRKLGKTHQNILIFFKGDPKTIKTEFGAAEIPDVFEV